MGRRVTVVLITWNSAPYLRRCLDGIARLRPSPAVAPTASPELLAALGRFVVEARPRRELRR